MRFGKIFAIIAAILVVTAAVTYIAHQKKRQQEMEAQKKLQEEMDRLQQAMREKQQRELWERQRQEKQRELAKMRNLLNAYSAGMRLLQRCSPYYCLLFGMEREHKDDAVFTERLKGEFLPLCPVPGLSASGFEQSAKAVDIADFQGLTPDQLEAEIAAAKAGLQDNPQYAAWRVLQDTAADLYKVAAEAESEAPRADFVRGRIAGMRSAFERDGIVPRFYDELEDDTKEKLYFDRAEPHETDMPALYFLRDDALEFVSNTCAGRAKP